MSNSSGNAIVSFGVLEALGVAFIILKLCDVIDWSWWLVTPPLWGPFALLLSIVAVGGAVFGLVALGVLIKKQFSRKDKQ